MFVSDLSFIRLNFIRPEFLISIRMKGETYEIVSEKNKKYRYDH